VVANVYERQHTLPGDTGIATETISHPVSDAKPVPWNHILNKQPIFQPSYFRFALGALWVIYRHVLN
jgi:hypothetical protein